MSDDDGAWRSGTGGARMSGSGARDGFGSPPWDPADPVPHPDLDDTQALPGLGSIPGPSGPGPGPGDPRLGRRTLFDGAAAASARADETRVDLQAAVDETDAADEAGGGKRGGERDGGKAGKAGK